MSEKERKVLREGRLRKERLKEKARRKQILETRRQKLTESCQSRWAWNRGSWSRFGRTETSAGSVFR